MTVKEVIELMKNKRNILGVDVTGLEHIGKNSDRYVTCELYDDLGVFAPKPNITFALTGSDISEIIDTFKGSLWFLDDNYYDTNIAKRYFAASEPNKLLWTSPKR